MKHDLPQMEPRLLRLQSAASYLSISPRLLQMLVDRGEIPVVRVPGVRRNAFDKEDLDAVVQRWKTATVEAAVKDVLK